MTSLPRPTRFEVPRHRVGPLRSYAAQRRPVRSAAAGLIALGLTGWADQAHAQLGQEWEAGPGWSFQLTPYLWMIGIEGDLATLSGVPPVEVDWSFADVLDNLDLAFASFLEARAFSILTELSYLRLGGEADLRGPLLDDVELTTGVCSSQASALTRPWPAGLGDWARSPARVRGIPERSWTSARVSSPAAQWTKATFGSTRSLEPDQD